MQKLYNFLFYGSILCMIQITISFGLFMFDERLINNHTLVLIGISILFILISCYIEKNIYKDKH